MAPISSELANLIRQAEQLIAVGKMAEATEVVKRAYAQDKTNPDVLVLIAQLSSDPTRRRAALLRALQADPNHPKAIAMLKQMDDAAAELPTPPRPSTPNRPTPPSAEPPRPARPVPTPTPPPTSPAPTDHSKPAIPRLWLGVGGAVAALILVVVVVLVAGRGGGSPDNVARSFIHAVLNNDDNAAMNALSNDSRAQTAMFCSPPFVACLARRLPVPPGTQDTGAAILSQSGQGAVAQVRLRFPNSPTDMCASVQMQNEGGWKVVDTLGGVAPCGGVQAALVPTQPASANTAPLDATGQAAMQTATQLAVTRNALLVGPTLTATFLAPGFTQTALVREQDSLNTIIAATQTQAIVLVTQAAQLVGLTSTSIAQTQTAATAMQQAVAFKARLTGTIATSKIVNGQPHIVLMNADGSNLKVLDEIGVDPAWSPDGKQIAFANREHGYWVHVMAASGTADTELNGKGFDFSDIGYPTWSLDGTRLMFEASRQFRPRVLVISGVDGSGLTQVLDGDQAGGFHSWSPDGTQVLYTKDDQIWLANVIGAAPRSILKQSGIQGAAWSPDGKQIAFDAGNDQDRGLYLINADGSNVRRITSKAVYPALAAWSSDGKYIAAQCHDNRLRGNNLCVMNTDGTSLTFITTDGGFDARIAWFGTPKTVSAQVQATVPSTVTPVAGAVQSVVVGSPSLSPAVRAPSLAFGVGGGQGNILQLWTANPDGSDAKALTGDGTFVFPGFAWSPDGKQVAFIGYRSQQFGLYVFDAVTNAFQTVIITGSEKTTQSYTVSWSPDGSAIAYMGDDGLYTITPDGKTVHRIVPLPSSSFHHSPIWSADSQKIAYVSDDDIYLVNRDGSGMKSVTKGRALQAYPSPNESGAIHELGSLITWTPDGRLTYTIPKVDGAVYIISTDGTGTKMFLKQPYILSWSPDGKQLVGLRLSADLKVYGIYTLNADGTGTPKFILKFAQFGVGVGVSSPVWRP